MENIFTKYGDQVRLHPVELFIDSTSGKYFLPDDVILRNETIIALSVMPPIYDEANSAYFVQNSPDTDRPFITPDAFYSAYIVLKEGSDIIVENCPLSTFALFPGDKSVPQIFTTDITPSKSYVIIGNPTATNRIATGESIVLNFYYLQKSGNR